MRIAHIMTIGNVQESPMDEEAFAQAYAAADAALTRLATLARRDTDAGDKFARCYCLIEEYGALLMEWDGTTAQQQTIDALAALVALGAEA